MARYYSFEIPACYGLDVTLHRTVEYSASGYVLESKGAHTPCLGLQTTQTAYEQSPTGLAYR